MSHRNTRDRQGGREGEEGETRGASDRSEAQACLIATFDRDRDRSIEPIAMAAFAQQLGLGPQLTAGLLEQGWLIPTPVQQECVPLVLGGGDVLAAAETGSGKTAAFALPIVQSVHETLMRSRDREQSKREKEPDRKKLKESTSTAGRQACLLSEEDRDAMLAVSKDGLICQSRGERAWSGGRATMGVHSGRHYYEVTVRDEGLCRVGWACTQGAQLELGTCQLGFGYGGGWILRPTSFFSLDSTRRRTDFPSFPPLHRRVRDVLSQRS